MGRIKDACWDWLDDCGYDLGYDWDSIPQLCDWDYVKLNQTTRKEYYEQNRCKK